MTAPLLARPLPQIISSGHRDPRHLPGTVNAALLLPLLQSRLRSLHADVHDKAFRKPHVPCCNATQQHTHQVHLTAISGIQVAVGKPFTALLRSTDAAAATSAAGVRLQARGTVLQAATTVRCKPTPYF
jgi:hypothetical protein